MFFRRDHTRKRSGSWKALNVTEQETLERLRDFGRRYRSYKRVWSVEIEEGGGKFRMLLVDRNFEPIRQPLNGRRRIKPDVPRFLVTLKPVGSDCVIKYEFRWLLWKKLLAVAAVVFEAAYGLYACLNVDYIPAFVVQSLLIPMLIVWLVKNYRHDMVTIAVFRELIEKNFEGQWI